MSLENPQDLGKEFLGFQSLALDYLYDMPLANDSLFLAEVYTDGVKTGRYRVKKITFTPPKVTYEYDPIRRVSVPSKIDRSDVVTIEWYEDAYNTIQKWTMGMINGRINNTTGLWRVGSARCIDRIEVYHFAYVEGNPDAENQFDSVAYPKCTDELILTQLTPEGAGELTYDSDAGGSVKTVSVTYHCQKAELKNYATAATEWNKDDFSAPATTQRLL